MDLNAGFVSFEADEAAQDAEILASHQLTRNEEGVIVDESEDIAAIEAAVKEDEALTAELANSPAPEIDPPVKAARSRRRAQK